MPVRNVGKWLCAAFIAWTTASTVVSCGGSGNGSVFTDGGLGADGSSGGQSDATTGGDGPKLVGDDGGESGTGCTPKTCAELGYNCGQAVTCGTIILDCGGDAGNNYGCPAGEVCGGGGSNVCGTGTGDGGSSDGGPSCTPKTCQSQGYDCGYATDGCGNIINCNPNDASTGCTAPAYCGGGGYNVCGTGTDGGGSSCTSKTCAKLGYNCGAADDGCGNASSAARAPRRSSAAAAATTCADRRRSATCSGGGSTTLTGYVYDPANSLPIYNALVYVPVGDTSRRRRRASTLPRRPAAAPLRPPTPRRTPASTGAFTLTNLPSGAAVTVVVQLGKWQRVFTQNVDQLHGEHRLERHVRLAPHPAEHPPRGQHPALRGRHGRRRLDGVRAAQDGHRPRASSWTPRSRAGVPTAAGRVHFYEGSIVAGGAIIDANTPKEKALTEAATVMDSYDVLLFPCQGSAGSYTAGNGWPEHAREPDHLHQRRRAHVRDALSLRPPRREWHLLGDGELDAQRRLVGQPLQRPEVQRRHRPDVPDRADPRAMAPSARRLRGNLGGDSRSASSAMTSPRSMLRPSAGSTRPEEEGGRRRTFRSTTRSTRRSTSRRPAGASSTATSTSRARSNNNEYTGVTFPSECPGGATGAMTPQEKLLEFMLFDLTSCVSPPVCTPLTCSQLPPGSCGPQGDGCGNTIQCPACPPPDAGKLRARDVRAAERLLRQHR